MQASKLILKNITKTFPAAHGPIQILDGVDLELSGAQNLAITGPSGSGKSTLLHIMGTLDLPSGGQMTLDGQDPTQMSEAQLAAFRNQKVGFIFQDHHLLPQYNVLENVLLPTVAQKQAANDFVQRADELIERVGLSHRKAHRPDQLSGGERQRVAVARALILEPKLVLCDEPTGNLDSKTADAVCDLLLEMHQREQNILVAVTHSQEIAGRFQMHKALKDGQLT